MVLYVTFINLFSDDNLGIIRKIKAQCRAMEKCLDTVCYTALSHGVFMMFHDGILVDRHSAVNLKESIEVLKAWARKYGIRKTYIRYFWSNDRLLDFYSFQRENDIRTILEIPTFPYDDEIKGQKRIFEEDILYRTRIHEYFDFISTYSLDKEIWGKRTLNLINGVSVKDYCQSSPNDDLTSINIIAVGSKLQWWNGFERVIEGINDATSRKEVDIKMYIVGSDGEENHYRKIIEKYRLENKVYMLGLLEGDAYDKAFDGMDIAISALGMYKKNISEGSPIKGAEYCARGIPMISGIKDLRFPEDCPFVLRVPNNDTPIKMEKVVSWYNKMREDPDYKAKIRKYAEDHLDWDAIMKPVIEYFNSIS